MYLYICESCKQGHHEHCAGTQLPPVEKGMGGSKCTCECNSKQKNPELCPQCGETVSSREMQNGDFQVWCRACGWLKNIYAEEIEEALKRR